MTIITDKLQRAAWVLAISAFVFSLLGYLTDPVQFYFSYLVNLTFWLSIALGALFLLMVHHLTGAVWSVVLRRLLEMIQSSFVLLAILFLPVLFGIHELYHWSHTDAVAGDKLLQLKSPFLNPPFFVIRSVGYFAIWIFLSRTLFNKSLTQDDPAQPDQLAAMHRTSAYGMILFALSLTFASFDWLMSLDPYWYSTIYGVYFFSGCVLAALAFLTLTVLLMRRHGILTDAIGIAHLHDLGRLLFSFMVFWAYMAFSQYFLIWYGNIPEETIWFQHRWHGNWKIISLLLVLGHFVLPFFLLMMRWTKRNPVALACLCIWLLFMHWIDLFWLVMPSRTGQHELFSWQDIATFLTIAGAFIWFFSRLTSRHPLLPIHDPQLTASKLIE